MSEAVKLPVDTEHKYSAQEDNAMTQTSSTNSAFNAPMLVSWIYKNVQEEPTLITGLQFILSHMETADGCELLLNNEVIASIFLANSTYKNNPPIQLLCIKALRRLLDCNYTRDRIIGTTDVLRVVFSVGHNNMDSSAHVEVASHCVTQCSRSEICRQYIMERCLYGYMTMFSERYPRNASIVRATLKLYNWVTTSRTRMETLCRQKCVANTLKCMKLHVGNSDVLAPAMLFLTRSAASYPPAMEFILKKKAIPIVIEALKALYSNDILQLEGLKMIQQLSRTTEGWHQISAVRGGWQVVCQGTALGDALVHDLPGDLNNPGWSIGETPHLPELERKKLIAAKVAQSKTQARAKAAWTSLSLREFMGLAVKGQSLAVNNESNQAFFELVNTLDLLPYPGEEREYWFIRIADYEKESSIKLDDMVSTILEMKAKESKDAKEAAKVAMASEYVKEVYVMGQQVTTEMLEKGDMKAKERLEGII